MLQEMLSACLKPEAGSPRIFELIMGFGKTKVVTPYLLYYGLS